MQKFVAAINAIKARKAPGEDSSRVYKYGGNELRYNPLQFSQDCWHAVAS